MLLQDVEATLAGVFAPICTPFADNEDVDYGALRFNIGRYAESGILGYLALGSNGENRRPDHTASPLRRARTLARLLSDDAAGAPLLADAGADLTKRLNLRLDGLAAEHADDVEANVADLLSTAIARTRINSVGEDLGTAPEVELVATHARDVARDAVRVRSAALLRVGAIAPALDAAATEWVKERLDQFRVPILNTVGATRDAYTRVQEQTTSPEAVTVQLRANERAATKDAKGDDLPKVTGHVFSDPAGTFTVDLNDWERAVVDAELARDGFVAWYRNPGSATPASLRIAYQNDAGAWASLQPDFIVVSRRSDGSLGASIVDPHGDHLADARAKLRALAAFAAQFGNRFVRIESIAKVDDGSLRVLDLGDPVVRADVLAFHGAKVTALYQSGTPAPSRSGSGGATQVDEVGGLERRSSRHALHGDQR